MIAVVVDGGREVVGVGVFEGDGGWICGGRFGLGWLVGLWL
jgi:hypothetical protein